MKLMENMKKERKDNRGFSLVELIIVIAIMAILVGIVGTQVIPYLNKSRESKDQQILNSFSTAAVSAYSLNAEDVTTAITINVYESHTAGSTDEKLANAIIELTGIQNSADLTKTMSSTKGKTIKDIQITITPANHSLKVIGVKTVGGSDDSGIAAVDSVI